MKKRSLTILLLPQFILVSCASADNTPADCIIEQTEINQYSVIEPDTEVTNKETTINISSEICSASSLVIPSETLYDNSMRENYTDLCREYIYNIMSP